MMEKIEKQLDEIRAFGEVGIFFLGDGKPKSLAVVLGEDGCYHIAVTYLDGSLLHHAPGTSVREALNNLYAEIEKKKRAN